MKQQKFKRHRYFHFTTHLVHPKWLELSLHRNWLDFLRSLHHVQMARADEVINWNAGVLMSNHLHLLFSTESYNEHSLVLDLEEAMKRELGTKGPLFQRPLPCEPLYHLEYFKAAYKYIYRNPVEAGLVNKVQSYPYSSLALFLDRSKPTPNNPFIDPFELIQDLPNRLRWLNSKQPFQQLVFPFFDELGL